ncbi:MAG TPA: ribosome maturation factor RimM [Vicinamibacteria bacterium]|nr:ribosome maturation factor RimM [Vicinamibacteria bacterium]
MDSREGEAGSRDDLVAVGSVVKAQGRHGEVVICPFADSPQRFLALDEVHLEGLSGSAVVRVERARVHKGRPVLKLEGVSDMSSAEALRGKELHVRRGDLADLPEGSFYHFEILGLRVWDRKRGELGVVEDVLATGGTDVLVVRDARGTEVLVPLCREICLRVDPPAGLIAIDAPEGLVELNAN